MWCSRQTFSIIIINKKDGTLISILVFYGSVTMTTNLVACHSIHMLSHSFLDLTGSSAWVPHSRSCGAWAVFLLGTQTPFVCQIGFLAAVRLRSLCFVLTICWGHAQL